MTPPFEHSHGEFGALPSADPRDVQTAQRYGTLGRLMALLGFGSVAVGIGWLLVGRYEPSVASAAIVAFSLGGTLSWLGIQASRRLPGRHRLKSNWMGLAVNAAGLALAIASWAFLIHRYTPEATAGALEQIAPEVAAEHGPTN